MWSFDVYDTCLTRNYAHPKDVFREVAVNNSSELERQLGEGWIEIFSDARHQAQSLASEAKQGGEPSLIEIYKQVKKALPFIQSTNYIASELQIEQESLRPCSETKELVMQDCSNALLTFWYISQKNPVSLFQQSLINPN